MDFAWIDGLRLLHPDRLHVEGKGNLHCALIFILSQLTRKRAAVAFVDDHMRQLHLGGLRAIKIDLHHFYRGGESGQRRHCAAAQASAWASALLDMCALLQCFQRRGLS